MMPQLADEAPGPIVLFGSGEAAPAARRAHAAALERITRPVRACVLETPAGFEPNSARVASRLADFLRHRFQFDTQVIPARKRGTPESPDEPEVVSPLLRSNYIMLGPGSPTYTVRQLGGSLAWQIIRARHRRGAALVLASAAAIATSAHALPVYEIYKVGQDLHWQPGLDLLAPFGGHVAVVPHWNNTEGGEELDTSHSYMGRNRFERLHAMLPAEIDVLGVDEHTAVCLDFSQNAALVFGRGGMTWLSAGRVSRFEAGASVPLETLGLSRTHVEGLTDDIPPTVWEAMQRADEAAAAQDAAGPSEEVKALVEQRAAARARDDWALADQLRDQISSAGWEVRDTPDGPVLGRI
jgi:hypothetical protein